MNLGISATRALFHGDTRPAADFEVFVRAAEPRTARIECRGFVALRGVHWGTCFRRWDFQWQLYLVEDDGVEMFVRYADPWENEHLNRAVDDALRRVA